MEIHRKLGRHHKNDTKDNSKNKNRKNLKFYFSFDSADCGSFMIIWLLLTKKNIFMLQDTPYTEKHWSRQILNAVEREPDRLESTNPKNAQKLEVFFWCGRHCPNERYADPTPSVLIPLSCKIKLMKIQFCDFYLIYREYSSKIVNF